VGAEECKRRLLRRGGLEFKKQEHESRKKKRSSKLQLKGKWRALHAGGQVLIDRTEGKKRYGSPWKDNEKPGAWVFEQPGT